MKQRLLTAALIVACGIFGVAAYLLYAGRDRQAPEITIEEQNISYTEGEKYDALLEGVSAQDNKDGDVTAEVFVDKIVPTREGEAVVYYGVTDSSNNVGTARRLISYTKNSMPAEPVEEPTEEEDPAVEETPKEEPEEAVEEPTEEESGDAEKEDEEEEELKPDGERPAIALTETEVRVKKGTTFDPISYVKGVVDDKDSRDKLYTRISADGARNTDKAGTYTIRYYVKDSDGNTSEAKTLTLIVE